MSSREFYYPTRRYHVEATPSDDLAQAFSELLADPHAGTSLVVHTAYERVVSRADCHFAFHKEEVSAAQARLEHLNHSLSTRAFALVASAPAFAWREEGSHHIAFTVLPQSRFQEIPEALDEISSALSLSDVTRSLMVATLPDHALLKRSGAFMQGKERLLRALHNPGAGRLTLQNPRLAYQDYPRRHTYSSPLESTSTDLG